MKFLADMGISPQTVTFLRSQGHDAAHLLDAKLERLADPAVMDKARLEGCVLLTLNHSLWLEQVHEEFKMLCANLQQIVSSL